jgi:hypothetical protein
MSQSRENMYYVLQHNEISHTVYTAVQIKRRQRFVLKLEYPCTKLHGLTCHETVLFSAGKDKGDDIPTP